MSCSLRPRTLGKNEDCTITNTTKYLITDERRCSIIDTPEPKDPAVYVLISCCTPMLSRRTCRRYLQRDGKHMIKVGPETVHRAQRLRFPPFVGGNTSCWRDRRTANGRDQERARWSAWKGKISSRTRPGFPGGYIQERDKETSNVMKRQCLMSDEKWFISSRNTPELVACSWRDTYNFLKKSEYRT